MDKVPVGRGGFQQPFHPGYGGGGRRFAGHNAGSFNQRGAPRGGRNGGRNGFRGGRGGISGRCFGGEPAVELGQTPALRQVPNQAPALPQAPQGPIVTVQKVQTPENLSTAEMVAQATALLQGAFASAPTEGSTAPNASHVAQLLQQAFAAFGGGMSQQDGRDKTKLEPNKELSKAIPCSDVAEPSQAAAAKEGNGKSPYCYRCFTKGHRMHQCTTVVYCDVCAATTHMTSRCPTYRGDRPVAIPCGYAV